MKPTTIDRTIIAIFLIALVVTNTLQSYAIISSIERSTKTEVCAIRALLIQQNSDLSVTNGRLKDCDSK